MAKHKEVEHTEYSMEIYLHKSQLQLTNGKMRCPLCAPPNWLALGFQGREA